MLYTRRELGKMAIAGLPAAGLLIRPSSISGASRAATPDSNWAGVQVGLNVPYSFGNNNMSADETLQHTVDLGVSAVELRSQPVEAFLGAPAGLVTRATASITATSTPQQIAAQKAAAEELHAWRRTVAAGKIAEFKKKYNDAGVAIEIVKFDGIYGFSDDDIDYCFDLAKALGARALSCEISLDDTKRLGRFADKHQMMVGYHGHEAVTPAIWETAFGYAAHNGANLDLGHFVAGNNTSPIPFLTEHHDRITHIHVKDRKLNRGPNVPFGQGDTPIVEALRLIRDKKWKIQATIEFEYPVPAGSDRLTEIGKCVQFCKAALLA